MKDHLLGATNCSHIVQPYIQFNAARKHVKERILRGNRQELGMAEKDKDGVAAVVAKLEF